MAKLIDMILMRYEKIYCILRLTSKHPYNIIHLIMIKIDTKTGKVIHNQNLVLIRLLTERKSG